MAGQRQWISPPIPLCIFLGTLPPSSGKSEGLAWDPRAPTPMFHGTLLVVIGILGGGSASQGFMYTCVAKIY